MNEIFRRRLIGLAVLLVLVFVLSLLLPKDQKARTDGLPTTTVALDGHTLTPDLSPPSVTTTPTESTESPVPAVSVDHPETAAEAVESLPRTPSPTPVTETKPRPRPEVEQTPPPVSSIKPVKPEARPAVPAKPAPSPAPAPAASPPLPKVATATPPGPKPPVTTPAKPAETAAAPAAGKPQSGTVWYVQIGSYSDAGNAQTTQSLLQNIGYRGETTKIVNPAGATFYRVRLGPFPSEAVARQAQQKVAGQGYPQARAVSEVPR